jgi:hypothetical protein
VFRLRVCSQALARCRTAERVGLPFSSAFSVEGDMRMMAAASALLNPCRWIAAANCLASVAASVSPAVHASGGRGPGRCFGSLCCKRSVKGSGNSQCAPRPRSAAIRKASPIASTAYVSGSGTTAVSVRSKL